MIRRKKKAEPQNWRVIPPAIRVILILSLIGAVGLALAYWQRDALRRFGNEWTAERHLIKAQQELEVGNYSVAVRRAITSLQLEPNRLDTIRVLIEAARKTGDSRLILLAQMMFIHQEATVTDKISALAAINDVRDAKRFELFWEAFPEESRTLIPARIEYVRYLVYSERLSQVIQHLEGVDVVLEPELGALKLEALLRASDGEPDHEALALALSLIENSKDSVFRGRIFARLASLKPEAFSPSFIPRIESAVANSPEAQTDPTFPYTLRIALNLDDRDAIVSEAIGNLQGELIDPLCIWLVRLEEFEKITESITEVQAYRSSTAFESRVLALIQLDQLEEAFTLLRYPPNLADRIGTLILRASVARSLGRESAETTAWQEALVESERDMTQNHYLKISRAALAVGERRVAADALVAACRHPRGILPPSSEINWLLEYLIEQDRPDDLLTVSKRFLESERSNPVLLNNAIYLSLIMNDEMEGEPGSRIVEIAEDLTQKHPGILGIRTTLALAYLKVGRHEDAKAVFRPEEFTGIGWQKFGPSDRAIFAMVLEANGAMKHATNVKQRISWSDMLETERAYFRQYLPSDSIPQVKLRVSEEIVKSEPEATSPVPEISPRMKLLQQRNENEKSNAGEEFTSERLKLLEERIEAERKAREEGSISERMRLLNKKLESERAKSGSKDTSQQEQEIP